MAYEYEAEEWRAATHTMNEAERAASRVSARPSGMCGDREDARDEMRSHQ